MLESNKFHFKFQIHQKSKNVRNKINLHSFKKIKKFQIVTVWNDFNSSGKTNWNKNCCGFKIIKVRDQNVESNCEKIKF